MKKEEEKLCAIYTRYVINVRFYVTSITFINTGDQLKYNRTKYVLIYHALVIKLFG